jgi:hypothetical protein
MGVGDYLRALRPAFDGSVAMAIAVGALQWTLPPSHFRWLHLIIEIGCGAAIYIATVMLLHRQRAMHFLKIAKRVRAPQLEAQPNAALP